MTLRSNLRHDGKANGSMLLAVILISARLGRAMAESIRPSRRNGIGEQSNVASRVLGEEGVRIDKVTHTTGGGAYEGCAASR